MGFYFKIENIYITKSIINLEEIRLDQLKNQN